MVFKILELMPAAQRIKTGRVCKDWLRIAEDPLLWQDTVVGHAPEADEQTTCSCPSRSLVLSRVKLHHMLLSKEVDPLQYPKIYDKNNM